MIISIIAAVATGNFAIGKNGDLCYHIREDMERFKELTMNHTIIMGRKTFDSLPEGQALPGRINIVISSAKPGERSFPGAAMICPDLERALRCVPSDETEVFIIGGGQVYKEAIDIADKLYLTEIFDTPLDADTFFPPYHGDFKCTFREYRVDNMIRYEFTEYERRQE